MAREQQARGSRAISFTGESIAEEQESFDLTDWDERHLALQIYLNDRGGFVASVEFSSSNLSIASVYEAQLLDTIEDVEKFFFAFDPLQHIYVSRRRDM